MKITCLIENTCYDGICTPEHGLSLFIETKDRNILMDAGASDAFLKNAENLGVDLKKTDIAVLSHGHYDHGGGMPAFFERYPDVKLYMRRSALEPHFHLFSDNYEYNGIDVSLGDHKGVVFTPDFMEIDSSLVLFSGIKGKEPPMRSNSTIYMNKNGEYLRDDFVHEQCLCINEDGLKVLVSGCAHNGIINILDRYKELFNTLPDVVISGFHLMQRAGYTEEDKENILRLASKLADTGCIFYTGHCTDKLPYEIMSEIMGDSLRPLTTGRVILLP